MAECIPHPIPDCELEMYLRLTGLEVSYTYNLPIQYIILIVTIFVNNPFGITYVPAEDLISSA